MDGQVSVHPRKTYSCTGPGQLPGSRSFEHKPCRDRTRGRPWADENGIYMCCTGPSDATRAPLNKEFQTRVLKKNKSARRAEFREHHVNRLAFTLAQRTKFVSHPGVKYSGWLHASVPQKNATARRKVAALDIEQEEAESTEYNPQSVGGRGRDLRECETKRGPD
ncbi:hypothetical protein C8R44DRAFT_747116 [Mycena epipterygia]|nr:hypothetical protein C8R44DRAFT_747116 [Mycena epipterygia]